MPTCSKCGKTEATVEMRRSPKRTQSGDTIWLCKERDLCKARRKANRRLLRIEKKGVR